VQDKKKLSEVDETPGDSTKGWILSIIFALALAPALMAAGSNPFDSSDADLDLDGDGLTGTEEFELGCDPNNADTDSDGLPDGWEYEFNMDPTDPSDARLDFDYGGGEEFASYNEVPYPYTNYDEFYRVIGQDEEGNDIIQHTDPTNPDSDGDGILDPDDPWPLDYKNDGTGGGSGGSSNPHPNPGGAPPDEDDPDGDGLTTGYEYQIGTDPYNPDTDGDGLIDSMEILLGYDANDWDTDNDGLMDGNELGEEFSTSGLLADTDSDGVSSH